MDNKEKFKKEYMCEWVNNDADLNPIELCLLHLYSETYKNCQWIHNQMKENPNDNLNLLSHEINRICHELEINSEKIFDILPHSGRLKPKKFSRYINEETIPVLYQIEYKKVREIYERISLEERTRQEEREKERYKDNYYFFKL